MYSISIYILLMKMAGMKSEAHPKGLALVGRDFGPEDHAWNDGQRSNEGADLH